MSFWRTSSVGETPILQLCQWRVYAVKSEKWPEETHHFVGYNVTEGEGRTSSQITEFDKENMRGKTRSGRIYELVGEPGSGSEDGQYVFNKWCSINRISECVDVTKSYSKHA